MAHSRLGTTDLSRRTLHAVPSSHSDRHLWHEVHLGEARWRIRVSAATDTNPSIGPGLLIDERPLVTVSRRDNARCDANVLTDDSRAYRSSQPDVLLHLLRARSIGRDVTAVADLLGRPLAAQERATLDAVTSGLNRVLDSSGLTAPHALRRSTAEACAMTASATVKDGANLRRIVAQIDHDQPRSAIVDGRFVGGLHLAVMTGPFLDLIIAGRKTVESRFHRQRRTPLFTAKPGDVVVFRQSGRPASVAAILGDTYYLDMAESGIDQIRATWAQRIGCDDDDFWAARVDARW